MRLGVAAIVLLAFTGPGASAIHPVTFNIALPYQSAWRTGTYVAEVDVHVDRILLRYRAKDGVIHTIHTGMLVPVEARPIKRALPTIPIPSDAFSNRPLFLTITSEIDSPPLRILTIEQMRREDAARLADLDFQLLLFAGFFIALALANFTLFASFRDRAYMAYAGVMVSAAAIAMRSSPDIFWAWLFPYASIRYVIVHDSTILAYSVCLVAFTRAFLNTRKVIPGYDRFLVAMYFVFLAVEVVAHEFFSSVRLGGIELVDAIYITFSIVPFIGGVLALRAGSEAARYYLIAFAGVFGSLIVMDVLGFFGRTYPLIIFFGMAWEGLWLIAALGERLRRLDKAALDLAYEHAAAALHDSLTGLVNRRKIEMDLRDVSPPFALLYVDLDHFSVVNATAGHELGDRILQEAAGRLDTFVHNGDTLARTSSDEFALLLKNRTIHGAQHTAHGIVSAIAAEPFLGDHQALSMTASVGCLLVSAQSTPSMLLALADEACAHAKEQGRNRAYCTTDDAAGETTRVAMRWVRRTSEALQEGRFALYFQLIVPLHEPKEAPRIEILVRMIDKDGAIVESSQFLPIAERFSLAASIDRWVIEHALPLVAPVIELAKISGMSVNLSGNALQDPSLSDYIDAQIRQSGIKPSALTFEITETVVLSMLGQVRRLMSTLHRQGVRFALDDFGTGTSSLGILRQLDVDYLKIDGAFVRDCATNPVDELMLKTIRDLANALGLKTIAEYAKDAPTIDKLREIGIDYAQGWGYAKAQPIENLVTIGG